MRCQEVANHTADYLAGDLNPAANARLQSHLMECAACRSELQGLSDIWTRLGVLPNELPGPDLRAEFYSMLEAYPRDPEERAHAPGIVRLFATWSRTTALRMVAAVLILVSGFALGSWMRDSRGRPAHDEELAQMRTEIDLLRQRFSLSLITQPSAGERLQGATLARRINNPDPSIVNALLDLLENDPNVNVRLSALDALYLFIHEPHIRERLMRSLGKQTSPVVQIALIDLLVSIREKQAALALKQLIDNEDVRPEVRQHAQSGIARLL